MNPETVQRQEVLSVPAACAGQRLDLFLAGALEGVSRKAIKQALDGGQVFVDGRVARKASQPLGGGEALRITLSGMPLRVEPEAPQILLLDPDLLVLNKPAGMPSHPTGSGRPDALSWAGARLRQQSAAGPEPILLHRLDADTSGVLLLARTAEANRCLARKFADRAMEKRYLALVAGTPPEKFSVENYLRAGNRGRTQVVHSGGQHALTHFRTLAQGEGFALVEAVPKTGRTHQIRVHLAESGYPLLGDPLYGGPQTLPGALSGLVFRRHLLHARSLEFPHPRDRAWVAVEAPLPADFLVLLKYLPLPQGAESSLFK